MNTGDTAWVMTCAALVFIMTPGVALFYGGLARRKNMLSVLMQCYFIMCLMSLQWVLFGYSLAFGPDVLGWFGFNAGSALGAGGLAANAFVTGALAGLVAITPACGFVSPLSSIAIGIIAGMVCYLAVTAVKSKFGYDDAFDVFGVHGVGGMWGTLATGLFAEKVINEAGANGLLFGNVKLFLIQGFYLVSCIAYALIVTWILYKVVDALFGMRVDREDELVGLDLTQHHESAYTILE